MVDLARARCTPTANTARSLNVTDRPNIIMVLSDEHRGQAMAHAGDANLRTPALDRLAAEGVSFGRAYANCPICTPSRGTIFSGRHAHAGPVSSFFDVYAASAPSLATELRSAGYRTAYFGKWHCGVVRDQLPRAIRDAPPAKVRGSRHRTPEWHRAGFEDWCAFESLNRHFEVSVYRNEALEPEWLDGYETDVLTEEVIRYLNTYDRDQPLFLVLSVTPPHFPLLVPEEWKRHDPATLEVRPNFVNRPEQPGAGNIPGGFLFRDEPPWSVSMRHALADYYAMVENLDWNIGRLRDALETSSRFAGEQTLFCYTADHGEFLGSHGLCERKEHPHEESVRVPLIFHAPGRIEPQGWRSNGLIGLVDFAPTLLGLVGLRSPGWMQGRDCAQAVASGGALPEIQLLEMLNNPRWNLDYLDWRGLVTERYKYAYYETGRELLFDLGEDPYEMHDLSAERPDLRGELRTRLLALLREMREPFFDVIMEHGVPCETPRNASGTDYRIIGMPVRSG
jgi:arylsulfatase A-like enzyme